MLRVEATSGYTATALEQEGCVTVQDSRQDRQDDAEGPSSESPDSYGVSSGG